MSVFFLEPSQVLAAPSLPSPQTSQFSCVAITVSKGNTNVMHSAQSKCDTTLQNVLIKTGIIYTQRETFQKVMFAAEVFWGGQMISRLALSSDPCREEVTGKLSTGGPASRVPLNFGEGDTGLVSWVRWGEQHFRCPPQSYNNKCSWALCVSSRGQDSPSGNSDAGQALLSALQPTPSFHRLSLSSLWL